jgi:hypothetical protein
MKFQLLENIERTKTHSVWVIYLQESEDDKGKRYITFNPVYEEEIACFFLPDYSSVFC